LLLAGHADPAHDTTLRPEAEEDHTEYCGKDFDLKLWRRLSNRNIGFAELLDHGGRLLGGARDDLILHLRRSDMIGCIAPHNRFFLLRMQPVDHARKCYSLAYVIYTANHATARSMPMLKPALRDRAVLAQIQIPLKSFLREPAVVDSLNEGVVVG
jgi:hypothetical protein